MIINNGYERIMKWQWFTFYVSSYHKNFTVLEETDKKFNQFIYPIY